VRFHRAALLFAHDSDQPACPADELAAASIRQARECRPLDPTFALRAGRQLALLLKEEYDRLRAILSRIEA